MVVHRFVRVVRFVDREYSLRKPRAKCTNKKILAQLKVPSKVHKKYSIPRSKAPREVHKQQEHSSF